MKNKTYDEIREALEATSEYKDYLEAVKAEDEAREAFYEVRKARAEAEKAMEATPEYKDLEKAKMAFEFVWAMKWK